MSRKYRQPGYQDEQRPQGDDKPRGPRKPRDPTAPRSPKMPGFFTLFRCAMCGAGLPAGEDVAFDSACPKCGAALHSCKNCLHFDPNSRFECNQPIEKRVAPKDAGNDCRFFEARTRVEKETTTASIPRRSESLEDPRAAFERLFKK